MRIEIRQQAFDAWHEVSRHQKECGLVAGSYGACAAFVGTMRDFNQGERVNAMTLEHYAGMTERQLAKIAEQAMSEHALLDLIIVHRVGDITPNEPIVLVAAWSAHRADAFAACREMMEYLKSHAPFWKKETLPHGERWVDGNRGGDAADNNVS